MMRRSIQIAALLGLVSAAWAEEPRRVEVMAAQEAARADLRGQLMALPIASGLSIKNLVDRDPTFPMDQILDGAEQIGGPRWIEQNVVQIRMQLPAQHVVECLGNIPNAKRDPRITPADLQRLQKDWTRRSFQATGQAIPVSRIGSLVGTVQTPAWRDVPIEARTEAANRAHASAVGTIVQSGTTIRIGPSETVEQSFTSPDAKAKISAWVATLPATQVLLRDDRQVEIGLFVDRAGLGEQLRAAMTSEASTQSEKLQALEAGLRAIPAIVVGRAGIAGVANEVRPTAPLVIQRLPDWASDPLVAEATAAARENRLRTARRAEHAAQANLKAVIEKLVVNDSLMLKQAAERDPRVAAAIDQAIGRARVYQVDYNPDGSATVRVTLDPNELLDALTSVR